MLEKDPDGRFKLGISLITWVDYKGRKCRSKVDAVNPDDALFALQESRGEAIGQILEVRVLKVIKK